MTKAGLDAARRFGSDLPEFADLAAAEGSLYPLRDDLLAMLGAASRASASFRPDDSPESLKDLERWYFEVADGPGFDSIGLDRETFERAMAMYLGEVLVPLGPAPGRLRANGSLRPAGTWTSGGAVVAPATSVPPSRSTPTLLARSPRRER